MSVTGVDEREELVTSAIDFYDKVMCQIWLEDSILILEHKDGTKDILGVK